MGGVMSSLGLGAEGDEVLGGGAGSVVNMASTPTSHSHRRQTTTRDSDSLLLLLQNFNATHEDYLQEVDVTKKEETLQLLRVHAMEYLNATPHAQKFKLRETERVLTKSIICPEDDFDPASASEAFMCLELYCRNIMQQPWRKNLFNTLRLTSGFFVHKIASQLKEPHRILKAMGYVQVNDDMMQGLPTWNEERLKTVSRDLILASQECLILGQVLENVVNRVPKNSTSLSQTIFEVRKLHPPGDHDFVTNAVISELSGKKTVTWCPNLVTPKTPPQERRRIRESSPDREKQKREECVTFSQEIDDAFNELLAVKNVLYHTTLEQEKENHESGVNTNTQNSAQHTKSTSPEKIFSVSKSRDLKTEKVVWKGWVDKRFEQPKENYLNSMGRNNKTESNRPLVLSKVSESQVEVAWNRVSEGDYRKRKSEGDCKPKPVLERETKSEWPELPKRDNDISSKLKKRHSTYDPRAISSAPLLTFHKTPWTCRRCTFENQNLTIMCEVCHEHPGPGRWTSPPKDPPALKYPTFKSSSSVELTKTTSTEKQSKAKQSRKNSETMLQCPHCTFENWHGEMFCQMCKNAL